MSYLNGEVSHWMHSASSPEAAPASSTPVSTAPTSSTPLPESVQDLVIVGGGLTGLWAAYYASRANPSARITVLEAQRVGYGASGRNGGWLSTLVPGNRATYARALDARRGNSWCGSGLGSVRDFQRALIDTVDEVLHVLESEAIDAHQTRGGILTVAQNHAGLARLRATRDAHLHYGHRPHEVTLLDAHETSERLAVDGVLGGMRIAGSACLDPALLVTGLAGVLEARGVRICEGTRAGHVTGRAASGTGGTREAATVATDRGPVRGRTVLVCVEGYTGTLSGDVPGVGPREVIPVFSTMIATKRLTPAQWAGIGWEDRACVSDTHHSFVYAQRTADDRIAIGGRGAPYAWNSGLPGDGEVPEAVVDTLVGKVHSLFPALDFEVEHAWRGALGVTRDWCAGVYFDPASGTGSARGYAGHGVTATNLAARTLLARAGLGGMDPETAARLECLPWNDHDSGTWEPEPLRWLGVHSMYRLFGVADDLETRAGSPRTNPLARFGSRLAGLHERPSSR